MLQENVEVLQRFNDGMRLAPRITPTPNPAPRLELPGL
jgi:hypothetical protein